MLWRCQRSGEPVWARAWAARTHRAARRQVAALANPKAETRNPKEGRNPKSERTFLSAAIGRKSPGRPLPARLSSRQGGVSASVRCLFGFRNSDFFRISGFGFLQLRGCPMEALRNPMWHEPASNRSEE